MKSDPLDHDTRIDDALRKPVVVSADFTAKTLRRLHEDTRREAVLDQWLRASVPTSKDFTARTLARLQHEKRHRQLRLGLAWVAGLAAILTLGFLLPSQFPGPGSEPPPYQARIEPLPETANTDSLLGELDAGLDPAARILLDEHALNTIAYLSTL